MTEIVKQYDNWSCMACVAAMITGETLQDVVDFVGHDGSAVVEWSDHPDKKEGFQLYEIDQYLMSRGYSFAAELTVRDQAQIGDKSVDCEVDFSLAMVLIAKSPSLEGCTHAMYWDGQTVFDPKPDVIGHRLLKDYEIISLQIVHEYGPRERLSWHDRKAAG